MTARMTCSYCRVTEKSEVNNVNDLEKAEIKQNKAIRGYIIRCLVKGYNNTALTRQLSNAMIAAGLIISPDISK